ncbi:MAG: GNAT family N-acetyltransferase [Pseudomonadota bacterium]
MNFGVDVPTLETERLILRAYQLTDFPFISDVWTKEEVVRHIGGRARTEEECWMKFLRMIGHWSIMGFGYWMIEDRATGAPVGEAGFADFKRDMTPSIKNAAEGGWVLAPEFHRQGLATEAMKGALAWFREHFSDREICCIIEPANAPSIRVAEKLGFSETVQTKYHGENIGLFHLR